MPNQVFLAAGLTLLAATGIACGSSDANTLLIGGECADNAACDNEDLTCISAFAGGYCGSEGCTADADCAEGSVCVTHEATNYCFLVCVDKADCNTNRTVENEANCVGAGTLTRVDPAAGEDKACVPPSSGM
jgi:hypothetical protein